jgi:hypothetical protein
MVKVRGRDERIGRPLRGAQRALNAVAGLPFPVIFVTILAQTGTRHG